MLHRIKSTLKKSYSSFRKRRRFESIHSEIGANYLESIYVRLQNNDTDLSDDVILEKYHKFSNFFQTNTLSAAELEWVSISLLCFYRPHLTKELIKEGLLCIVYSIGDEIDYNDVLRFIQIRILQEDAKPYGGLPPKEGLEWLAIILPSITELIQKTLEEVIEQNREELDDF